MENVHTGSTNNFFPQQFSNNLLACGHIKVEGMYCMFSAKAFSYLPSIQPSKIGSFYRGTVITRSRGLLGVFAIVQ